MAWYSGNTYERFMIWNRMTGPYGLDVLGAHPLQRGRPAAPVVRGGCARASRASSSSRWSSTSGCGSSATSSSSTSLHRDFLPSSWGMYRGTTFDWSIFIGTIGLFLTLFFLFIRFLPDDLDLRDADARAGARRRRRSEA